MKLSIRLFYMLLIFGTLNNICLAQKTKGNNGFTDKPDSVANEALAEYNRYIKEHELHKNNKDSAWINDFKGNWVWDSRLKSLEGKTITVTDSLTKNYYVLNSTHTEITAYTNSKQVIWKTNPRTANSLSDYRHKNPTISYFQLGNNGRGDKKSEKVIHINYSNSQFGYLDLITGKFNFSGQD